VGSRASRDLLVAGHVVVDHFLQVAAAPGADRTAPVLAERTVFGGTATNLALAAARKGLRVGLLSRIGDGFPAEFRQVLRARRIDLRGLAHVPGTPTPRCTILEEADGTTRTVIQQGPMASDAGADLPGPWAFRYRWLHLSTGPPRYYARLARAAHAAHQRVSVDPAQELFYRWNGPALRAILPWADILFGNRAEVRHVVELLQARTEQGLLEHVPVVVRTEGDRGATAFYRGGTAHVDSRPPRRRRTLVGAGDAFRGGFYAAWLDGVSLHDCLASGNREALTVIEGRGAR